MWKWARQRWACGTSKPAERFVGSVRSVIFKGYMLANAISYQRWSGYGYVGSIPLAMQARRRWAGRLERGLEIWARQRLSTWGRGMNTRCTRVDGFTRALRFEANAPNVHRRCLAQTGFDHLYILVDVCSRNKRLSAVYLVDVPKKRAIRAQPV